MSKFQIIMDTTMCVLWIATYTIVLIGTIRYRYPLIAPMTQAVIAPIELAISINQIMDSSYVFNYAYFAYIYWAAIEILIILVIIRLGYVKRNYVIPYILFIAVLTAVMYEQIFVWNEMLWINYMNTTVGICIWLLYLCKESYPAKPLALAAFVTKFMADILAGIIYFPYGEWYTKILCVALPVIDAVFFPVFFKKKKSAVLHGQTPV